MSSKSLLSILAAVVLFGMDGHAQNLTTYHDYRNYFYVFDAGLKYHVEYFRIDQFAKGLDLVAYVDNRNNLKSFDAGNSTTLYESHAVKKIWVGDDYVAFGGEDLLYVYADGKRRVLSRPASNIRSTDSLLVFTDNYNKKVLTFYKGKIRKVVDLLIQDGIQQMKVGDNIIGYLSPQEQFNVYYHDQTETIFSSGDSVSFSVGRNTLAFFNEMMSVFEVYHKGEFYTLENFRPQSFKVGDDLVAYVDRTSGFNVFFNGQTRNLAPFPPDFYTVKDSMLIYFNQGYFSAFYNGKVYQLENFMPRTYQVHYNSLAYQDQAGRLKALMKGKEYTVSEFDTLRDFELWYNTLRYTIGNKVKVFWRGKNY